MTMNSVIDFFVIFLSFLLLLRTKNHKTKLDKTKLNSPYCLFWNKAEENGCWGILNCCCDNQPLPKCGKSANDSYNFLFSIKIKTFVNRFVV